MLFFALFLQKKKKKKKKKNIYIYIYIYFFFFNFNNVNANNAKNNIFWEDYMQKQCNSVTFSENAMQKNQCKV